MLPMNSKRIFSSTKKFSTVSSTTEALNATQTFRSEIRTRSDTVFRLQQQASSFAKDEARRASFEGRLARFLLEHDINNGNPTTDVIHSNTISRNNHQNQVRGGIESEADAAFGPDKAAIRQQPRNNETVLPKTESVPSLSGRKERTNRKVLIGGAISRIPADSLAPVSGVKHSPHPLATVYISEAASFLTLLGTHEHLNKSRSTSLKAAASVLNAACSGAFSDNSEPLASTNQLYLSLASCVGRGDSKFESSSALAAAVVQAWIRRVENELNIEDRNRRETISDGNSSSRSLQRRFSVFTPSLEMLMGMAPGMESLIPDVLFVTDHNAKSIEESSFEIDLSSGAVQLAALKRSTRSPADYFKRSNWWEMSKKSSEETHLPASILSRLAAGHVPTMLSPLARILSSEEWEVMESRVLAALPDPSSPFLAIPVEVPNDVTSASIMESSIATSINSVVPVKLSKNIDGSAYNSSGASNSALDTLSSVLSLGSSSTDSSPSIHKAFLNSSGATRDHYLDFLARMQRARQENSQLSQPQSEVALADSLHYPLQPLDYTPPSPLPQISFYSEKTPSMSPPSLYPFVPSLSAVKRLADPELHQSQSPFLGLVRTPKATAVNISAIAQTGSIESAFFSGEGLQIANKKLTDFEATNNAEDSLMSSFSVLPSYRSEQAHTITHFRMLEAIEAKDLGAVLALFFEHCSAESNIDVLSIEIAVDACSKAGRSDIVFGLIWPFIMKSKIIPPLGLRFLFVKAASLSGDVDMALQLLELQEDNDEIVDPELFSKMYQAVIDSAKAMQRQEILAKVVAKAEKRGIFVE
jgi:hypothetical protein